jgi:hypothetical protein
MGARTVNFLEDLHKIQQYIEKRVRAQAKNNEPITAIEAGFKICQDGRFVLNFDTRENHDRDGAWTDALNGPSLALPEWRSAYMATDKNAIWYILLSGEVKYLPPNAGDDAVAGVFGKMLLAILQDAKARGVFDSLPLRKDCQIEVLEFDWMFEWPSESQLGRTNLFRKLKPVRLPKLRR